MAMVKTTMLKAMVFTMVRDSIAVIHFRVFFSIQRRHPGQKLEIPHIQCKSLLLRRG